MAQRRRKLVGVVAAAVVLLGLLGAPGPTGPAAAQALPAPGLLPVPSPLPAGPPGEVLASQPFESGDFGFAVEAHQILYRSTDPAGASIAVSGYVLVPTGVPAPAGGRHVLAWTHGTTGIVDGCAPSLAAQEGGRLSDPSSYDNAATLLAAGHVVVATDYAGLGTPGMHPYLDGVSAGRAVLDSIRAARAFGGTASAVIVGFSQGGHASVFAGEEWASYAPEIDLVGIVPIAVPNLVGAAFATAGSIPAAAGYASLILAGIVAGHPELDRTQILTPSGEAVYDDLVAEDLPDGDCVDPYFDLDRDLAADPMSVAPWRAAFEANNAGQRGIGVPVLMIQSESDEQALAPLAYSACQGLEAHGTDVRMWRYDDESHVGTVIASSDDRATWILDRLAGAPLTDDVAFTGEVPEVLTTCPAGEVLPPPAEPPAGPGPGAGPPPASPATPITGRARFTG